MFKRLRICFGIALLALTACGGGGGRSSQGAAPLPPTTPAQQQPASSGPGRVVATAVIPETFPAAINRSAQENKRSVRSHRAIQALSFNHVHVIGSLYEGYAGSNVVTNTQDIASATSSVTMTFSNLPVAPNEWVEFTFYGVAADGSQILLGQLGAFVNVNATTAAAVSLDANSTRRLEAALAMLEFGVLSTADLANNTGLDNQLNASLQPYAFDQNTQLFSTTTLETIATNLEGTYERSITVSTPANSSVSIVWDYTSPAETNMVSNVLSSASYTQGGFGVLPRIPDDIYGNPFTSGSAGNATTVPTSPPTQALARSVAASVFDAPSGQVAVAHVYGGNLLVSSGSHGGTLTAPSNPPQYQSGVVAVPPRSPGFQSVSVGQTARTVTFNVNDPLAAAMRSAPFYTVSAIPGSINSLNPYFTIDCEAQYSCDLFAEGELHSYVSGTSGSTATVVADAYSPWDIDLSKLQVCGGENCAPLTSGTINLTSYFFDNGTNLGYFAWHAAGGSATGVSANSSGGYDIAYSGGTNLAISTSVAVPFFPNQIINLSTNAPTGSSFTLSLQTAAGTYTASGVTDGSNARLQLTTLPYSIVSTNTTIVFSLSGASSSGTVTLRSACSARAQPQNTTGICG